jgi:hypothetical protein
MTNTILTDAEIKAIYAMDYVSEYTIEQGMFWDEVHETIIASPCDEHDMADSIRAA